MHDSHGRARRRALVTVSAVAALIAGVTFGATPSTAASLAAVEPFDATTTDSGDDSFPDEAMLGERIAFASDQLLLSTDTNGHSYRRVTDGENTALATLAQPDPGAFTRWDRARVVDAAATASGNFTAPFAERSLSLTVGQGGSGAGALLQLTSPSDGAEPVGDYTTYGDITAEPTGGNTYLIRTSADLQSTGAPALLTSAEGAYGRLAALDDESETASVLTQQWTLIDAGTSGAGATQFRLVSRSGGDCMTVPSGISNPSGSVCDDNANQLFELRDADGEGRVLLHNVGYDVDLYFDGNGGAISTFDTGETAAADRWGFYEVQQPDPIPASVGFAVSSRTDLAFDLAVGDLDGVTGAEGLTREEAVVTYVDPNGELALAVVDYNAGSNGPVVTTVDTGITPGTTTDGAMLPLTVDTADVDDDGIAEIVVTYGAADGGVSIVVAGYSADESGARTLSMIGTPQGFNIAYALDIPTSADAAVFDFNGDGVQELAWLGVPSDAGRKLALYPVDIIATASTVSVRAGGAVELSNAKALSAGANPNSRVRVESGQFVDTIGGSGSRQLAVAFDSDNGQVVDLMRRTTAEGWQFLFDDPVTVPTVSGDASVSMAVGGFAGGGGGDTSQWGIAVSAVGASAASNQLTLIQPTEAFADPVVNRQSVAINGGDPLSVSGFDLTSYDPGGQTLELGVPIVFTIEKLISMSLVGGQPPAHSDWLDGRFVNISRNKDFNLIMSSSSSSSFENQTSQESNQTYNLAQKADLKVTVKGGVPVIEKVGVSAEVAEKFKYTWNSLGASTSGASWTSENKVTEKTDDDDIVNAIVQDYQVTRYPVISVDTWNRTDAGTSGCEDGCYGYWDVVVPGEPHQSNKSGKSNDNFTATWQNGNALSYPQLDEDGRVPLTDVGTFDAVGVDSDDGTILNQEFSIGGNETTVDLDVSSGESDSTSETSQKGWKLKVNVKGGVSTKTSIPFEAKLKVDGSLGLGFNTDQLFTDSTTGATANSHDTSFELNVPEVDANLGYGFGVAYYYGIDGAARVTYGTDLTGNPESKEFWLRAYGQKPDPALNQPYNSVLVYNNLGYLGATKWNPGQTRQAMRGFTVRQPASDDPTTSEATYAGSPEVGDPVVFDVQVSNYSLIPLTDPLTVDFMAVPTTSDGLDPIGDPISIGRTTVTEGIRAQDHITVSSPEWTAQGTEDGTAQSWRIFAVLDKDDTIDEVHEWQGTPDTVCPTSSVRGGGTLVDPMTGGADTLECGQNNQAFGTVTVVAATDPADATESAQIGLAGAGVVTGDSATLNLDADSELPTVEAGVPSTVVIRADAERETTGGEIVMVYEGDPADGELVAVKRLGGVPATGTTGLTFEYTPSTEGLHELHAVLLASDDTSDDRGLIVRVNAVAAADDGSDGSDGSDSADGSGSGESSGSEDSDAGSGDSASDTDASGSDASTGDLASTGQEAWPWLLAGVIGALLIGAGMITRRPRSARRQ